MKYIKYSVIKKSILTVFTICFWTPVFAYDPYECLSDVSSIDTKIPVGLATELCSGTWNKEPVNCYLGASLIDQEIPRGLAIKLCTGTVDAKKTLECYAKSGSKNLNRGLATTLCGKGQVNN
ncbi:hypothetical protein [Aliivibrio fischeri]|uniref:Uncharacterized protein n=1 Tax=Aliivibrio fischeri TaxID=668 RepID=A0A510UN89_ALIFS|nr:hypothetical protein [Aliivibrio fischeri]GEK16132.1 hypothetical protein AFI02nite_41680 [Aliivibrio fischeri]